LIVQEIRNELEKRSNLEEKEKRIHWEKQYQERPKLYGIPSPTVRKISSKFFQKIKRKTKKEIIQLCNDLLESGYSEERTIAFDWAFRLRKLYEESDFQLLETWLKKHVHSWGACDDLCTHAIGALILQFPKFIQTTREWQNPKIVGQGESIGGSAGSRQSTKGLSTVLWLSILLPIESTL
jgi:3-methyladenine DNA glycosylase AlkD